MYTNMSTLLSPLPLPLLLLSAPLCPYSLPLSPYSFLPHQILLLTLRLSLPSVLRFSVCAGILYIAFMFLGWLVLGPYHTKVSGGGAGGVALFRSVCHGHYGG